MSSGHRAAIRRYPTHRGDLTVDVAIVGGGVTGAAAAWQFTAAGVEVALLEADRIAGGSTAASTALLMQEPDKDFHELAERFGSRAARRIWTLSREATREFIRTLKRLAIACDLVECDSVYFATSVAAMERLRREFRHRTRAGFAGAWLDERALWRVTGIRAHAGIRTGGNARVEPRKACAGLVRAAERRGAHIFERSRVVGIERTRRGVLVKTPRGVVRASSVVIATGYATPEFKPLAGRFRMLHTYVVATEPIRAATARALGLHDVMLWDTDRPYHYIRWTRDRRLMFGGGDQPQLPPARRRAEVVSSESDLREYAGRLYPAIRSVESAYAWEGLFAMTPDGLPYIGRHRRYPRHLFALGYGGNGMTFGFLAARLLVAEHLGKKPRDLKLFAFDRR